MVVLVGDGNAELIFREGQIEIKLQFFTAGRVDRIIAEERRTAILIGQPHDHPIGAEELYVTEEPPADRVTLDCYAMEHSVDRPVCDKITLVVVAKAGLSVFGFQIRPSLIADLWHNTRCYCQGKSGLHN
jgi:hypothetical protein